MSESELMQFNDGRCATIRTDGCARILPARTTSAYATCTFFNNRDSMDRCGVESHELPDCDLISTQRERLCQCKSILTKLSKLSK